MKPQFDKVAIVGLGQIGGSLGMALIRRKLAGSVVGIDLAPAARRGAIARRACHESSSRIESVRDVDLVVLAVPIEFICQLGPRVARFMKPGAILMDVGSTKVEIARAFSRIPGAVPTHPMCGTENVGIKAANPELFVDAPWVMTRPSPRVSRLIRSLGARPCRLSPADHDKAAALVSHLPYAFALALSRRAGKRPALAAGSFRSATRVAAQDPVMGLNILLTNRFPLARELDTMAKDLKKLAADLRRKDFGALFRFVEEGHR